MGLLGWLKRALRRKKRRKYPYARIRRVLGKWEPYDGMWCLAGTRIPLHIDLPEAIAALGAQPGRMDINDALFPYWLRLDSDLVGFVISQVRQGKLYKKHRLAREGKAPREIDEPEPVLKFFQRRILDRILEQIPVHDAAHGFIKKRSIFTNAAAHTGKRVVICMDLRDFFPSITFKRVTGMFINIGFSEANAGKLAALCCYGGRLPQGAPTSPMITNIICRRMDARLHALLAKYEGSYTRYADDMTFSGGEGIRSVLPLVRRIIKEEGFEPAPEKFRIQRSGARQKVTGLVVNDRVSVPRKVRRLLRAMVHRYSTDGVEDRQMYWFLTGMLNFMRPAHEDLVDRLEQQLGELSE